jgi:hypothetical protein
MILIFLIAIIISLTHFPYNIINYTPPTPAPSLANCVVLSVSPEAVECSGLPTLAESCNRRIPLFVTTSFNLIAVFTLYDGAFRRRWARQRRTKSMIVDQDTATYIILFQKPCKGSTNADTNSSPKLASFGYTRLYTRFTVDGTYYALV